MAFSIYMGLTVIVAVSYFVIEKRLHVYEQVFTYLLFTMVFVTTVDLLTPKNSQYLKVSDDPLLFAMLRLVGVGLIPLVVLFYLEGMNVLDGVFKKGMATLLAIGVLFGVESGVIFLEGIHYDEWQRWWSLIGWFLMLMFAYGSQQGFRRLLRKEGVVS